MLDRSTPETLTGIRFDCGRVKGCCIQRRVHFAEHEVADSIYAMDDPKDQKFRAKKLANFNATSWDDQSEDILMNALRSKFSQNEELKKFLLATGTTTIGEASAHDTKYGIGLSLRNPNAMNTDRWRGENLLGVSLMKVRDELIN